MIITGLILSTVNYVLTTVVFFSRGDSLLGWIQLIVIPAELVLPWVAHPLLGMTSLVSLVFVIVGSSLTGD